MLSIISLSSTIVGLWLLGTKNKNAFIVFSVGVVCQLVIYVNYAEWFLFAQSAIVLSCNIMNYFKWRKDEK